MKKQTFKDKKDGKTLQKSEKVVKKFSQAEKVGISRVGGEWKRETQALASFPAK